MASVKDPLTLQTTYIHDGFGRLTTVVSPVTGTTTTAYDSGGNVHTVTDARGAVATYGFDALNWVTSAAYTLSGTNDPTITFAYDTGTNGKGRLVGASDANHALAWSYDALGRVIGKGQTVGGVTRSVGYGYTNGNITTITTPSGQTVTYAYSDHQITGIAVNTTALLTNVTYEPFGPVRGWTWGNATNEVRLHNTDGDPSLLTSIESVSLSYDAGYRLTNLTNSTNNALSWVDGYDLLDRVNGAVQSGTNQGFTYDGDGNRLTQAGAPAPGQLWTNGATFTYNARGRMATAVQGGTTTYIYNALAQMIEKTVGSSSTTMLLYDEAGHLLGEYTGTGLLIQETVWLGDLPVATLRPNGTGISIYYVHADQLGTPRIVSRPTDNAVMWRWDSDPFGTTVPNQNPTSQGTFVYNLRSPGQYYQVETGLNYNYFRDYDPQTGRYIESDPIGLHGGINTYAYTRGNPVSFTDPRGTDVRIENTSAVYGFHQHIVVDAPNGPYAISFGMDDRNDPMQGSTQASGVNPVANGTGSGVVYPDPDPATAVADVLHTNPSDDLLIAQILRGQVGNRGPYNVGTNSCRTFSRNQFDNMRILVEGPWWQRLLNSIVSGLSGTSAAY